MIVVEIPAALAERPEVVPVDGQWPKDCESADPTFCNGEHCDCPLNAPHLVGRRVALAWRETCPCGTSAFDLNVQHQSAWIDHSKVWFDPECKHCTEGSRMVVGWTAEVAAVVPCQGPSCRGGVGAHVCDSGRSDRAAYFDGEGHDWVDLPAADWSAGRYALVLRDVRRPIDVFGPGVVGCPAFTGYAELGDVL